MNHISNRCAVIGAAGFIGQHIVHYLISHYGIIPETYDIHDAALPNFHQLDLSDKESVQQINLAVDYIFVFAGLTGTHIGFDRYIDFVNTNELGLLNLLDAIRHSPYKPKIIFPSTRLVYKGQDKPLQEDDANDCKTVYAANKLACEALLRAYRYSFDIPFAIFRICIPYGNLLSNNYSFGTIGFFIKQASAGKDITLYGGGKIKRTFTHMEDLCQQIIKASFLTESDGNTYNIGGETLSLYEAAITIANKYGVNVVAVPWPEKDLRIESDHTYFDDSSISKLLGPQQYKRLVDFSADI